MKYSDVKIQLFPPTFIAHLQSLDMDVISSLKSHYRRILLNSLVEAVDKGSTYKPSTTNAKLDIVDEHITEEHLSDEMIVNIINTEFGSDHS